MRRRRHPQRILFALAAAALLVSAALPALREHRRAAGLPSSAPSIRAEPRHEGRGARAEPPGGEDLPVGRRVRPALLAGTRAVEEAARRFLAAFGRYEVGRLDGAVARRLRRSATVELATTLLAAPPRRSAGSEVRRARVFDIEVTPSSGAAPRAVARGSLRRGSEVESFAFEFERHGRRWLAAGVAR